MDSTDKRQCEANLSISEQDSKCRLAPSANINEWGGGGDFLKDMQLMLDKRADI